MASGHPVDPGSLDPDFAKFREKKLTDKHARPAPAPKPPRAPEEPRHGDVGRADPEFAKFREKKLTEQAADEIAKNEKMYLGAAPWEKKKEEDENAHRRMKLSDLNLPGKDDRPEGAPPQVGETFKLIDIALGQAPPVGQPKHPAPARPAGQRPGAPPPPRPQGKPVPGRPPATGKPPAGRPVAGNPAGARPPTGKPGGPPAGRPGAPPAVKGQVRDSDVQKSVKAPPKAPPPMEGFMDRFDDAAPASPAAEVNHFEDTSFAEASEADDPYELKDDGGPSTEFQDDGPRPPAPPSRPGGAPRPGSGPPKKPPPRR